MSINCKTFSKEFFCRFPLYFLTILFTGSSISSLAQVWTQVPTPNPGPNRSLLRGISGTSSSDIWTVGYYEAVAGSNKHENLILHWNGSFWQQHTTVDNGSGNSDLYDVEVISENEAWAAGQYAGAGGGAQPQLFKWNGSSWTKQTLPPYLTTTATASIWSLDAISANDVWAVGGTYNIAYALHYNGSSWTQVHVPQVGLLRDELNAVHGLTSNDVWAVGSYRDVSGQYRLMARHWNGSSWTNSPMPASVSGQLAELLDVRMVSTNDVWAIGYSLTTGGIIKLHWNGSVWSVVTPPNGGGGALAPLASNNIYSVGAEISHWNGSTWTIVETLSRHPNPALVSTYVAPNGDVWAAGRTSDGTNMFKTLVYRTATHTPSFTNGTVQSTYFPINSGSNSLDMLLRTADNDISQVLTYSVVTPPSHGTLSGFPDTAVTANGFATPSGLSYTPQTGYAGNDQFVIEVSVGTLTAQTTINVNVSGVLPVTLIHFTGKLQGQDVQLQWSTASEANNPVFVVERSPDGHRYESVAQIPSRGTPAAYHYTDKNSTQLNRQLFYRLLIQDQSGKKNYSNIVVMATRNESDLVLRPNPVQTQATVLITAAKQQMIHYHILQMNGHMAASGTAWVEKGKTTMHVDVSNLAPGAYVFLIEVDGVRQQLKFIKQ